MSSLNTLLLFLLIVVLAWVASRLLGRQLAQRPGGLLQVRGTLSLGRDRSLLLVAVGDQVLLIGTTAQSITLVSDLAGAGLPAGAAAAAPAAPDPAPAWPPSAAPDFGRLLRQFAAGTQPAVAATTDVLRRGIARLAHPAVGERPQVERARSALGRLRRDLDAAAVK